MSALMEAIPRIEVTFDRFGNPITCSMYHPKRPDQEIVLDNILSVSSSIRVGEIPRVLVELDAMPIFIYKNE